MAPANNPHRGESAALRSSIELRQLEAFVAVATDLHFARAAARLHMSAPSLSETVRHLERELGTPLLIRTTRRVALTPAGRELLERAVAILDLVHEADTAVRRMAAGDTGTVRVGITPPVAPVLGPHLVATCRAAAPDVTVELRRMWLPDLADALAEGDVDVAVTCGLPDPRPGIAAVAFCAEDLQIGLRPDHRLAGGGPVEVAQLAGETFGATSERLFPAWALSQRQALLALGISPPTVELDDTDLAARRWTDQRDVDWILLIPSLSGSHRDTAIRPVTPRTVVPFVLLWRPDKIASRAALRFVETARTATPPPDWITQPGHFLHPASP